MKSKGTSLPIKKPVVIVDTKLGKVEITITGPGELYLTGDIKNIKEDGSWSNDLLTVRGIKYRTSVNMKDHGNGNYNLCVDDHGNIGFSYFFSREGFYGRNAGVSDSASKVLLAEIVSAGQKFAKENPRLMLQGAAALEESNLNTLKEKRLQLVDELNRLDDEIAKCQERYEDLLDSSPCFP